MADARILSNEDPSFRESVEMQDVRRQIAEGGPPAVFLLPLVAAKLDRQRQPIRGKERGGILLGRVYSEKIVVIEDITEPGPGDKAGRCFFDRNRERAQKIIEEVWTASGGEMIYLGEWHSHPEDIPTPSSRDRTMISNMWSQSKMTYDSLLLIIVGRQANWQGYQVNAGLFTLSPPQVIDI